MVIELKKPLTKQKLINAKKKITSATKGFDAKKHSGKLKNVFGDALKFQKELRNDIITLDI